MDNLQQRKYYKIFSGTNQIDGYDKIHLGYEAETTEVIFKKNKTTFFHVPFFAASQQLNDSSLGGDGATFGPIPALADRIYKKQGGYGKTTPWGTPTGKHDGAWLCSWYYAVSTESPKWVDRYYDPGRLAYEEALEGYANFSDYISSGLDNLYYDVYPSALTLEPGAYYQYYHHGEKSTTDTIQTFAGEDKTRLRLNIENWGNLNETVPSPVDASIYNHEIVVENFNPSWVITPFNPGYQDLNALSFNNKDFVNCKIKYDENYSLENEFTLTFWVNNTNWQNATSTQLVGNLNKSGFSVFYNNLNYNPFFVVPETTYGHLFYINQDGNLYNDKNTQFRLAENSSPVAVNINSEAEVITFDDITRQVVKYNYIGDAITVSKNPSGDNTFVFGDEFVTTFLDKDDNYYIVTKSGVYKFNRDLVFQDYTAESAGVSPQYTFNLNGQLISQLSSLDLKFDSRNNKWHINLNNQILYNDAIIPALSLRYCTNIAVDPENNIWVLADSNKIIKIDFATQQVIDEYEVGVLSDLRKNKNISFIRTYNRESNDYTWYAVIYYDTDQTLYQVTLDGKIYKTTFLPQRLNISDPAIALQNRDLLSFRAKGDFTGYEHRRIFNKVLYNNIPQVQFKLSVRHPSRSLPDSTYKISVPVPYFVDNFWHLITVTVQNQNAKLYIDDNLRDELTLPNFLDINYQYQNDFIIGCPNGRNDNINKDMVTTSIIWNGAIDTVRIYDYAIEPKFIQYFAREKAYATDIEWNIPTASLQYIEVIERFFKHQMPGAKSPFFKIKLSGTKITDPAIRSQIEADIKLAIERVKPAYTELLKVEWVN